jgi:SHS2 domain-containing protein
MKPRAGRASGGGVRLFGHTADIGLAVRGTTLEDLFAWAAVGLVRVAVRPRRRPREAGEAGSTAEDTGPRALAPLRIPVDVPPAPDPEGLLVGWLNFLIYLLETEGLAFEAGTLEARRETDGLWRLTGELAARPVPPRGLLTTVKAATYHGLRVEWSPGPTRENRGGGLFRARVILDV